MKAIEYKNICMSYNGKNIIENFNLEIEKGEFVTIIGSSGCGKTTILKMVNKLIVPTSGNIIVCGECTNSRDIIELRRSIGYAIQGSVLFPHLTVEKNIAYVPNLISKDKNMTERAVKKWMKIVGLDESLRKNYPDQLSGGQQQRVGIARALAGEPEIVLMDEPFGAVDEITRATLQDEIIRIHKETGVTIMFVTHDINEALKLGTKVLVMNNGKIQQYGTPSEIRDNPANELVKALLFRVIK